MSNKRWSMITGNEKNKNASNGQNSEIEILKVDLMNKDTVIPVHPYDITLSKDEAEQETKKIDLKLQSFKNRFTEIKEKLNESQSLLVVSEDKDIGIQKCEERIQNFEKFYEFHCFFKRCAKTN